MIFRVVLVVVILTGLFMVWVNAVLRATKSGGVIAAVVIGPNGSISTRSFSKTIAVKAQDDLPKESEAKDFLDFGKAGKPRKLLGRTRGSRGMDTQHISNFLIDLPSPGFYLVADFPERSRILMFLPDLGGVVIDVCLDDFFEIETSYAIRTNGRLKRVVDAEVAFYINLDSIPDKWFMREIESPLDPDWQDYLIRKALERNPKWRLDIEIKKKPTEQDHDPQWDGVFFWRQPIDSFFAWKYLKTPLKDWTRFNYFGLWVEKV